MEMDGSGHREEQMINSNAMVCGVYAIVKTHIIQLNDRNSHYNDDADECD